MKKINVLVLGFVVAITAASCIKGDDFDPAAQYEIEKPQIEAYAKQHLDNPHYSEETGIWYDVIEPGDPDSYQYNVVLNEVNPAQSFIEVPVITVNYEGRLVSTNEKFDSNDKPEGARLSLGSVIQAWILAFLPTEILYDSEGNLLDEPVKPLGVGGLTSGGLTAGSKIRIVAPSYQAYGHTGSGGGIPADSPLYFEITVLKVEAPDTSN